MPANSIDDRNTREDAFPAPSQPLPRALSAGAWVVARGHRCRLETTVRHTDCDELHLTREADGTRRILLWPFDRPAVCADQRRPRAVRLRVWAASVLRDAARTIDPLTPRSRRSSADLIAFQLAPAVAAAGGVCRLLLADEVGLGKTIQAGWIVSDVLARDPDARILLAVPAGVRHQWASELAGRFNLQLSVVDARWLRNTVADIPGDSSPWTAPGIYVGSIDFLKRPDVAEGIASHVWDLLVVDEAHTAAAPTDRHTALQRFAARSRRVVAITATPYSGTPGSFASLASIGATPAAAPPLMFRRSRADVGDARRRRHRFARVRTSGVEGRFQRLLERYSRDVWNEPLADRDAARLAVTILRKRALSSPAAAAQSLRRRLALLQGRGRIPRQLALFEDDDPLDDEVAPGSLAAPGLADAAREHRCLAALIAAADAAAGTDSKLRYLRRLVGRVPRESLVVFTEYRDTLLQIAAALPPSLQLHGGLASPDRAAVQRRFNAEGGLLLATDAAAEGLNLHEHCRMVVNYELPWNPARLEQRIGRVDRIGQRRTVHALTLTARDTAEDLVIGNLARRLSRIVAALGADDRLGAFLDDARTAGIVIGGDAVEALPDGRENDTVAILRHDGDPGRSGEAARQIAAHRRIAGTRDDSGRNVLVSSMRARAGTPPPGYVAALSCTARTIEGFPVAVRQFLLHLEASPCRPCTAGDVRRAAAPVIERLNTSRLPAVDVWFAGVCDAHDAAAAAMAARERELSDRPRDRAAVQPGLFDRRALAEAARIVTTEDRLRQTHLGEIERLERSRPLHLSCGVSAVLILWR